MNFKTTALLAMGLAITVNTSAQKKAVTPVKMDQFIGSLMQKMTVDEKIGQLTQFTSDMDNTGPTMRAGYKTDIRNGRVGSIFNAYTPKYTRILQKLAVDSTRLHIPLIFGTM